MRTGQADLPLHGGRAPRWLFERMVRLSREMALAIVEEEGTDGLLRRISDPIWFQALGCVLVFDWHSSRVTTTVCGALKEGAIHRERRAAFFAVGEREAKAGRSDKLDALRRLGRLELEQLPPRHHA